MTVLHYFLGNSEICCFWITWGVRKQGRNVLQIILCQHLKRMNRIAAGGAVIDIIRSHMFGNVLSSEGARAWCYFCEGKKLQSICSITAERRRSNNGFERLLFLRYHHAGNSRIRSTNSRKPYDLTGLEGPNGEF